MSDDIPSDREVRQMYVDGRTEMSWAGTGYAEEFDRWLARVRAAAWDEGYQYATNGKWGPGENPYEENR